MRVREEPSNTKIGFRGQLLRKKRRVFFLGLTSHSLQSVRVKNFSELLMFHHVNFIVFPLTLTKDLSVSNNNCKTKLKL